MSVIVKGMEMPKSCNVCIMCVDGKYGERCLLTNQYIESIIDNCPLVELHEKHGRLIDADALINKIFDYIFDYGRRNKNLRWGELIKLRPAEIKTIIDDTPTILESEG